MGPVAKHLPALTVGIVCAAAISACAGAGHSGSSAPGAPAGTPGGTSGPYRWLVHTAGAPPSIAAENRFAGTTAWRLPGPANLIGGEAHGPVEGYVAEQAIAPGQLESVYVNAPGAREVTVNVYRMGWYGGTGGRLVLQSAHLPAITQPPCTHSAYTGLTECRWRATLSFEIPRALPSGVYIVKLNASDGAQS